MILAISPARVTDTLGVSPSDLVALLPPETMLADDPKHAAALLAPLVEPGDIVLTLGAGDVTHCGPHLLRLLGGTSPAGGSA